MKIALVGSMSFAETMLWIKGSLEDGLDHTVVVPAGCQMYVDGSRNIETKWEKLERDVFREYFEVIKQSDALLVLNLDLHDAPNYIGGNTLIEMGFAYVLEKKIFLMNEIPKMPYTDEIEAMKPIVIHNDLEKIV